MKVLATFYEPGYSPPNHWLSVEVWPSIKAAEDSLVRRWLWGAYQKVDTTYVDGRTEEVWWPGVGDEAELLLYACPPGELTEDLVTETVFSARAYPDLRLSIGPRGGIRREKL